MLEFNQSPQNDAYAQTLQRFHEASERLRKLIEDFMNDLKKA